VRTYGTLQHTRDPRPTWIVTCEPHVMMRLKRVFQRIDARSHGRVRLADTTANAHELRWFMQRYPLETDDVALAHLERQDEFQRQRNAVVEAVMAGKADFAPRTFPMAIAPREYQKVAAELALRTGRLLIADDLGLGKTAMGIAVISDASARPALVVTLTHLTRQWAAELQRFAPSLVVHVAKKGTAYPLDVPARRRGGAQAALPGVQQFPDVVVMNYHKLAGWADALGGVIRGVVFDEAQELRHSDSNKAAAARHIAGAADVRVGLTATPIYNYGAEMFNVLSTIAPDALGTQEEFLREWCAAGEGDKARIRDPKAFGMFLRDEGLMIRRTRADVGRELPPISKVPHYSEADLDAIEKVATSAAELAAVILRQGGTGFEKMRAAEELDWKLRQATGIAKAPYVAAFVRILVESGEKVVLYGWHHEVYALWRERLDDLKPVMFTGEQSIAQKEEAKRAFVEGDARVLIMSLRAGAGLDGLQAACRTVVFGELDWSPGVHEQCVGRVARDGQKDPVAAYFLIAEMGSDPVIADVLGVKTAQIEGIRDPDAALVEQQIDPDKVKRLAEAFLEQRARKGGGES
jgi:SNF2 family DNA or RNA helicase